MSPVLISSGVERQLPYTVSKDFAVKAKTDGKVKEIDTKNNMMILEYKDGTHEAVNLNPVVVKNGGGGFYLANTLKSQYKVGERFKANDIIAVNDEYFSSNYDGIKFNIGTLCKAAILSSFATFEDAKTITEGLSKRLSTEMIMKKNITLGPNATIQYIVKKGQSIKVGEPLLQFEQSNQEKAMNKLLSTIGSDLKEEIKDMGKNTIKSKYTGVIEDIRIYSTLPVSELSPSLGKVVESYWNEIKSKKKLIRKYKITKPEDQGNTYYELDEPIKPDSSGKIKGYKVDEGVVIEFYIKFLDPVGAGDKLTDFTALKGVVSLVIPEGQEPYTVDRPDEPIETILPASSVMARKVPSILVTMLGNKVLVELKNHLKEMYEKG